ncbi:MAG: hypothetical protein ABIJ57_00430 [Pseudomonadota bacterium]
MLLVEFTINGTLHRVSMEGHALTHYWDALVIGLDAPTYQLATFYGGYAKPSFGSIRFSHDLFAAADWPPPVNGAISIYYSATTEEAKELVFTGTAHISRINREEIEYDLYGPSYTVTVGDGENFNDTLVDVATWFCGASYLNLALDSTYARVSSPQVVFLNSGVQIAVNLFSEICAFFTHCFHITGGTLYLIDMLRDAGTETITEFDFFPSEYDWEVPIAVARASQYSRFSIYPYGQDITLTAYADTQERIEAALDNVILVSNKAKMRIRRPLLGSFPTAGTAITVPDTSLGEDTSTVIRSRSMQLDFENGEVITEGEGEIS